jgi:hypothetical protein
LVYDLRRESIPPVADFLRSLGYWAAENTASPRRRDKAYGRDSMAKGLYRRSDGQVMVEYGNRPRVPIPSAQYKANGYKPPCDKLPPEVPRKARKELADAEA